MVLTDTGRKPVVTFDNVAAFGLNNPIVGNAEATRLAKNASLQLRGSGLIATDDCVFGIPAAVAPNVNASRLRGKVKGFVLVGSTQPLENLEEVRELLGAITAVNLKGDKVWKRAGKTMKSVSPTIPNLPRMEMDEKSQVLFDLANAGQVRKVTVRHHPLELVEATIELGADVRGVRVWKRHSRPASYLARIDIGEVMHPRSLVALGNGPRHGSGLMAPSN